ncbi:g5023 [Coccomyxa elongata]
MFRDDMPRLNDSFESPSRYMLLDGLGAISLPTLAFLTQKMSMAPPVELINLEISPFSLRARWVLTYHGIPFKRWDYTPIIGETWMKAKAGKLFSRERVTAPVLLRPEGNIFDSFDIAKWADDHSKRPEATCLFPADKLDDITRWNEASQTISSYGRTLAFKTALSSEEARLALVPPEVLKMPFGRSIALAVSAYMVKGMQKKFKDVDGNSTLEKALEVIEQLRAALKANGGQYVLGKLSYADVVLAITVAGTCPPGQPRQLPPARATVQTPSQELYDACKDLQPWADNLLDKHLP